MSLAMALALALALALAEDNTMDKTSSTIREACIKELKNPERQQIYNNGRYFDTSEIYELWGIAFNQGFNTKEGKIKNAIHEYLLAQHDYEDSGDLEDGIRYQHAFEELEKVLGFPKELKHVFSTQSFENNEVTNG